MTASAHLKRKILVVDDEPMVCEAVRMMLNFDGHAVETAGDAFQALALLKQQSFDLVLTDYAMPAMQGDALAQRIKEQNPAQAVVMITAYAEMLPQPMPAVDFVISKPFLLENLRQAITRACGTPTP